ncbi:MAG: hypothetical protein M3R68_05970 [Acidobacteriota bacterium]|nr:hypothetical protein [Acidobacteriota bacterium]
MTKNQKIAAGCGAVGCLGLIVVSIVVGALLYFRSQRTSYAERRGRTSNLNINVNSNQNSNASETANSNDSSSSSTATKFSDEDKHKLFQAASMSQDADLLQRVVKKLGLFKADGTPADEYPEFIKDHVVWGASNTDFISSLNTPEKARAYVDAHLGE